MTQYYLKYFCALCDGTMAPPEGITLTGGDADARAAALLSQIEAMGAAEFVRRCAQAAGEELPQEVFDRFDPAQIAAQLEVASKGEAPAQQTQEASQAPVSSEIRNIYEVFLDSVCLDDALVQYLIDILKREAKDEFDTLSRAAARTRLDMDDFLRWFSTKELRATDEEKACAVIMDACLARLQSEGELELLAALLSGDEKTFRLFRTQAPELVHLPDATYEWYCRNYLDKYYPVRFLMRFHGVPHVN